MIRFGFLVLAVFISLIPPRSYSQVEGGFGNKIKMGGGRHGKHNKNSSPIKAGPGKLVGHCTMLAGNGNLIDGPCVDTLLILNDKNGNELVRTRTDKKGEFDFEAAQDGEYKITSGSHLIEVVSPTELLHSGGRIELKLKQN